MSHVRSNVCDTAIATLRQILSDLVMHNDGRNIPEDILESFGHSPGFVNCELLVYDMLEPASGMQPIINLIGICVSIAGKMISYHGYAQSHSSVLRSYCGLICCLSFIIPSEHLSVLIEHRFTVVQIAEMLGVSVRTIRRRISSYWLSVRESYFTITDNKLDEIVLGIQRNFPTCGNSIMQGYLLAQGHRVQHHVRDAQHRIDPDGSVLRRLRVLNGREYSVSGPLAFYHIDGNYKLIRFVGLLIFVSTLP
uniref:Uncharacterized protein n=1 Tax=Amphimedon queenslandica TaxID=400682 RepID=A0A1X7V4S0_AMPQE